MSITLAQLDQAADILEQGTAARSSLPPTNSMWLQRLQMEIYVVNWVPSNVLKQIITAFILNHLPPFQKALDSLAGDAVSITQHAAQVDAAAAAARGGVADLVRTGGEVATGTWQGEASATFQQVVVALLRTVEAYGAAAQVISRAEVAIGGRIGAVRQVLTDVTRHMVTELVKQAIRAGLNALGAGLWAGIKTYFTSWFDFEKAKQAAIDAAIRSFKAWAIPFLQGYLQHMAQTLQQVLADVTGVMGQITGVGTVMDRAAAVLEGGSDPGAMDHVAPNTPAASARGTLPTSDDFTLAKLNKCFPGDGDPSPYDRVWPPKDGASAAERAAMEARLRALGYDPALFTNDASGFSAGMFVDPVTGKTVVVITGTDFSKKNDVMEDAIGGLTMSPQSRDAQLLAQAIARNPHGDDVVYTGHSLGGRLAAVASMTSGNPAVTFNSAGVSPATVNYLAQMNGVTPEQMLSRLENGQVRAYRTADDVLTHIQEREPGIAGTMPNAVGRQFDLGGTHPIWGADGHVMDNVVEEWKKKYPHLVP